MVWRTLSRITPGLRRSRWTLTGRPIKAGSLIFYPSYAGEERSMAALLVQFRTMPLRTKHCRFGEGSPVQFKNVTIIVAIDGSLYEISLSLTAIG